MFQSLIPWVGACAALLTSLSYIPQVQKAWPRGSTSDLSLKMLIALTTGLLLWIGYGLLGGDAVIVAANGVGATLQRACLPSRSATCVRGGERAKVSGGRRRCPGHRARELLSLKEVDRLPRFGRSIFFNGG
jgi:MtN3 and saliva related transmembrane protein